jgi:hypothetical protein
MVIPFGLKAVAFTSLPLACISTIGCNIPFADQIRAVPSSDPVATTEPSRLNAAE